METVSHPLSFQSPGDSVLSTALRRHFGDWNFAARVQLRGCRTTDSRKSDCKFARPGSQNVLIMDSSLTGTMQRIQSEKNILDEPDSPLEVSCELIVFEYFTRRKTSSPCYTTAPFQHRTCMDSASSAFISLPQIT